MTPFLSFDSLNYICFKFILHNGKENDLKIEERAEFPLLGPVSLLDFLTGLLVLLEFRNSYKESIFSLAKLLAFGNSAFENFCKVKKKGC